MPAVDPSPFGSLLRHWRAMRHMSQLDLASSAQVSSRHVSFVETGRSRPSREMVLHLAGVLDVPLRERNVLLEAAGYAPRFRETSLQGSEMSSAREAVALILRQHEPFSAVALDRHWNVLMGNRPYLETMSSLLGRHVAEPGDVVPEPRPNALRLLFRTDAVRDRVRNWLEVAAAVLARVDREARWTADPGTRALLAELQATPGAPPRSRWFDSGEPPPLVIPVEFDGPDGPMRYLTTMTTLGAAQDITLHELRIEAYHPADAETAARTAERAGAPPHDRSRN